MPLIYDTSYEPNLMHFGMWTTFWSRKWIQVSFFKNLKKWKSGNTAHKSLIFSFATDLWHAAGWKMHPRMLKICSHALLGWGYRCMKKNLKKKKSCFRKKKSWWLHHDFSSIFRVYHSIARKLEDTDWIWKKPHVEGVFLRVVLFKKSKSVHWLPRNESVNGRYMTRIPRAHVILLIYKGLSVSCWLAHWLAHWLTGSLIG